MRQKKRLGNLSKGENKLSLASENAELGWGE